MTKEHKDIRITLLGLLLPATLLLLVLSQVLYARPTFAKDFDRLSGGITKKFTEKIDKQAESKTVRQCRGEHASATWRNLEGSYDTGLRDLPIIDDFALGEALDEFALARNSSCADVYHQFCSKDLKYRKLAYEWICLNPHWSSKPSFIKPREADRNRST